ncbi:TetR/AcrR family transcriptional regulator [Cellulomonas sp. SLBN-39]|uniref:TetR/AcrR family transcriptional regulator n=1 Tax=Cellulomonas sp. SLBN-39 TaxID=2768446 RepID=UPI00114F896D|nr:TetR/AcrR family transcriptional regulator [Cellulomonas sp. SLBN-39]TQL01144.1 TetR family transcriptional regulator [Cellulomonas sp. SLBN-39]
MAGEAARTRDRVHGSATRLFAAHGYAGTSVRRIAADAGVDPALVIRHFTSKEALFLDTMHLDLGQPLDEGPVGTLGERFVRYLLDADDHVRGVFLALVRASALGPVGSRLRTVHEDLFVAPLRARLEGADADLRARLAAALVGGLLYALWVAEDEVLRAADRDVLARTYGGQLQALLTPAG